MIVISEDGKGFVEVASWEDLLTRPGFLPEVDPKEIKLKRIIGRYRLPPTKHPCGLKTCHQPHFQGYIVLLEGGHETNIGHICGKRHFEIDWEHLERQYKRLYNEQRRRETIGETQNRVAAIRASVQAVRGGEDGADEVARKMRRQCEYLFDESTQKRLGERAKRGNAVVTRVTRKSREEIEEARAMGDDSEFNEEVIFSIAGVRAFTNYKRLKSLLETKLGTELDAFEALDPDSMDYSELRQWSKWAERIDPNLREAEEILDDCKRFLVPSNIKAINQHKRLI
ncbi:hypothetical protein [Lentisalinibacter salinarum]|uniref:hypothetical protein n=1 Tax=Lentisalinibacter salinarum TaxID=2992239 RepID=UPI00386C9BF5